MIWLPRLLDKLIPISMYAEEAVDWGRCAVGEFHKELGTPEFSLLAVDSDDQPRDKRLLDWGTKFGDAVESNDRKTALRLYRRMFNYITKGGVKK